MKYPKILIVLIFVTILCVMPNLASAQETPPAIIYGIASNNGAPVPAGNTITALVNGVVAETTTTKTVLQNGVTVKGKFAILVKGSIGDIVSFKIGPKSATETLKWPGKGAAYKLNLTAGLTVVTNASAPSTTSANTGLTGGTGDKGPTGNIGSAGLQGPAGAAGATGIAGPDGLKGIDGISPPASVLIIIAILLAAIAIVTSVTANFSGYTALGAFTAAICASIFTSSSKNNSTPYARQYADADQRISQIEYPPSPQSDTSICRNCRTKINANENFCSGCGDRINAI